MKENYLEIDLFDLVKDIFKKWKVLLVFALIAAILGCLFSLYQIKKPVPAPEVIADNLKSSLTQEEINDVEDAAKIISTYRNMFAKQKAYIDNSIYQNLDPYSIDTLTITYYVDNHYQVSYPIINETNTLIPIIQTYSSIFDEDAFFSDIAAKYNVDSAYIQELVSVDYINEDETETGVFDVVIYAEDENMLLDLGDYVKKGIDEKKSEITGIYGDYDISLVSEARGKTVDSEMAKLQSESMERITLITKSITEEEKAFSGDKLLYLKFLIHEDSEEKVSFAKNMAVGAVMGFVLGALYCAYKYFSSGTIKTDDEIKEILKVDSFGNLDNPDYMLSKINSVVSANDCKRIAIVTTGNDEDLLKLADDVSCDVLVLNDVLNSKEEFEKLALCDSAIMVEKLKSSKRKEVIARKSAISSADAKLLGVIVR